MFNTCVISLWVKLTSTGRVCNSLRSCGIATLVSGSTSTCHVVQGVRQHEIVFWMGIEKRLLDGHQKTAFGQAPKNLHWTGIKKRPLDGHQKISFERVSNSTILCTHDLPKCRSSLRWEKNWRTYRREPPLTTYRLRTDNGWWDDGQTVQI